MQQVGAGNAFGEFCGQSVGVGFHTLILRRSTDDVAFDMIETMLYSSLQKLLFKFDAEKTHNTVLPLLNTTLGGRVGDRWRSRLPGSPLQCLGLDFANPVGLAAGLDKNADYIDGLANLGFGFIEVGTVTPLAQPGNDLPRMFRLPQHEAIINRMGFNNKGVDYLVEQVKKRRYQGVLGINIGKNKDTPNEQAVDDYIKCLRKVYLHADYITVNISSPNTPGLRDLQFGDARRNLLQSLKQEQLDLAAKHQREVPLLVKIAPDMTEADVSGFADDIEGSNIDGVIATNTTNAENAREQLQGCRHFDETGGLSGAPLTSLAQQSITSLGTRFAGKLPLVSAGGIMSADDAAQRFEQGANLVQLYTGFIYRGPRLIRDIVERYGAGV